MFAGTMLARFQDVPLWKKGKGTTPAEQLSWIVFVLDGRHRILHRENINQMQKKSPPMELIFVAWHGGD